MIEESMIAIYKNWTIGMEHKDAYKILNVKEPDFVKEEAKILDGALGIRDVLI